MGFDFVELFIDELDECLVCLEWLKEEWFELVKVIFEIGVCVLIIIFSGYCCFLMGFNDFEKEVCVMDMMKKCIVFV